MLADKLRENIKTFHDKELAAKREEEQRLKRLREETRLKRSNIVDHSKDTIVNAINRGLIPRVRVVNSLLQEWIRNCNLSNTQGIEDIDLWTDFIRWATSEGLKVIVNRENNGIGEGEWTIIMVEPLDV